MVSRYIRDLVARRIAGDIVWSNDIGRSLKKWREIFNVLQIDLAKAMGVSPSVISDYEKGRRVPGAKFIKRFVDALLRIDEERGWTVIQDLAKAMNIGNPAIIYMREFDKPVSIDKLIDAVKGCPLTTRLTLSYIYGYTVLDSIEAIESLSGTEFFQIMGITTQRALIFTRVTTGRSPMVAVRVSPLKPTVVVIHGTRKVDPLAIRLADKENVTLILSLHKNIQDMLQGLASLWY